MICPSYACSLRHMATAPLPQCLPSETDLRLGMTAQQRLHASAGVTPIANGHQPQPVSLGGRFLSKSATLSAAHLLSDDPVAMSATSSYAELQHEVW